MRCVRRRLLSTVRVRYAPSPTGFVHLGGLRTALFNYLHARHTHGEFFVRFEDTDQTRLVPGSDRDIERVLQWAGIAVTETPEYQSRRLPVYQKHAEHLLREKRAYRCFCTRERLEGLRGQTNMYPRFCLHMSPEEVQANLEARVPHTIRLHVPHGKTVIQDTVRGRVTFDHKQVDDQILMKSDGFPTYHMASVVDDHLMRVSDVIRGEEWLPSTVKHVLLYEAFGWEPPRWAHLPLLLSDKGGKLSKRHDDAAVASFVEAGYLPEALVNFVAFLGWTPEGTEYDEVMSMDELAEKFTLERVHKGGAAVSRRKLDWLQAQHVGRKLESADGVADVERQFFPFVAHLTDDSSYALRVLRTIYSRLSPFREIAEKCQYFFRDPDYSSAECNAFKDKIWTDESVAMLASLERALTACNDWQRDELMPAMENCGYPRKQTLPLLRFAVTGTKVGATMSETMETLGRETVLRRLHAAQSLQ